MADQPKHGVTAFIVMGVLAAVLATASVHYHWVLWLAVSVGALGGMAHELAQSGGKILYVVPQEDGLYLGSLAGIALGAVSGILVVRGHLIGGASDVNMVQLSYEVFTAGLALKGIAEAAVGQQVPKKP